MNISRDLIALFSIIAFVMFISCHKEPGYKAENKPPIAHAGNDTFIILPVGSVPLNGGESYDPDGEIRDFLWSRISGPSQFTIIDQKSANAILKDLIAGIYHFELKVTDNNGSSATDTVMVTADEVLPN